MVAQPEKPSFGLPRLGTQLKVCSTFPPVACSMEPRDICGNAAFQTLWNQGDGSRHTLPQPRILLWPSLWLAIQSAMNHIHTQRKMCAWTKTYNIVRATKKKYGLLRDHMQITPGTNVLYMSNTEYCLNLSPKYARAHLRYVHRANLTVIPK